MSETNASGQAGPRGSHREVALLAGVVVTALPSMASAHPGHGSTDGSSWLHFVTEPVHVMGGLAVLAVGASLLFFWRRHRHSR
jgi:putative copper export protein